jgi:hypothetical protein
LEVEGVSINLTSLDFEIQGLSIDSTGLSFEGESVMPRRQALKEKFSSLRDRSISLDSAGLRLGNRKHRY